jgi:hypothetical protein
MLLRTLRNENFKNKKNIKTKKTKKPKPKFFFKKPWFLPALALTRQDIERCRRETADYI